MAFHPPFEVISTHVRADFIDDEIEIFSDGHDSIDGKRPGEVIFDRVTGGESAVTM